MEQQEPVTNGKVIVRRSEEEILKHLDDQEKSGFTVKEYCEMIGIVEQTFYSWLKKYRVKPDESPAGFAQIELVPGPPGPRAGHIYLPRLAISGCTRKYQQNI